jgi:protein-disulfide isomerase
MSSRQEQKAQARARREQREREQARTQRRRRRLLQLGSVAGVAAAVVIALALVSQGSQAEPNASAGAAVVGAADARAMLDGIAQHGTSLGDPKAPMVLTEFADLQCPFCRDYTLNVLPQVVQRYVRTGKLRLELRMRGFLGPDSDVAARAAYAAAARDRMWNFIDVFYRNQGTENTGYVTTAFLSRIATASGLPASPILAARTSSRAESSVQGAEREAVAAGLSSTPSFLVGKQGGKGTPLAISSLDAGSFTAALDAALRS